MRRKYQPLNDRLYDHMTAVSMPPDELLTELIAETDELTKDWAGMQISPAQGSFMFLLTRLIGAQRALELGTFTGYSSICIARALPPDGKLTCCDDSPEWTCVAERYWRRAGLSDRIELRQGEALPTVRAMPRNEQFDLAFLDADKASNWIYYEEVLPRLRRGGVILIDNALSGVDSEDPERSRRARELNERISADGRTESVLLPIADGLILARKSDDPAPAE
jgi:caffeoyl-CoA O-methyltransferase